MHNLKIKQLGFNLIELILFMLIIAIITTGILAGMQSVLNHSHTREELSLATRLAEQRMAIVLGQRRQQGFSHFTDPCTWPSPPNVCALPVGYHIQQPTIKSEDNNHKLIHIRVTGTASATVIARVFNYEQPNP